MMAWASNFSFDTTKISPPLNNTLLNFSFNDQNTVEDHVSKLENGKATGLDGIGLDLPDLSIYF